MAPFPYIAMATIVISLVSDQVAQMGVFAYAGFMVEDLGVVDDKDKVGYYAGLLIASYMVGHVLSCQFWGLITDRYGSRLVFVFSLLSSAVLSVAFGLSKTFTWAFVFRFLIGLLNGMEVASRPLVEEVCGPEHKTVGMGFTTSSWSLGAVLGSGVGGMLVHPENTFPGTFSQHGIFGRNPYLLANIVGAGLALLPLPLVLIYLEDKHAGSSNPPANAWYSLSSCFGGGGAYDYQAYPTNAESEVATTTVGVRTPFWMKLNRMLRLSGTNGSAEEANVQRQTPNDITPENLMAHRHIWDLMVITAIYSVAFSAFDCVFNLWALSSAASGGLNWSSLQIGQTFFICGVMVLVFEIFAVPYLTPWLGIKTSQRLGTIFEVLAIMGTPLLSILKGSGLLETVAAVMFLFTAFVSANAFYVGLALTINNATRPERRGELNGMATASMSLARVFSPIASSSLFAFTIDGHHRYPFDYRLTFYLLAFFRLVAGWMGWNRLTEANRSQ